MGELMECQQLVHQLFAEHDVKMTGELTAEQLQILHSDMRMGGISLPQVHASIDYVCVGETCEVSELFDLLQEMDRRYFLVQNLCWEFTMLDIHRSNTIPEAQAKWLAQMVHGTLFSKRRWDKFIVSRATPGCGVTFPEIEVLLCNIPSIEELTAEEEQDRKDAGERARKQRELERQLEEERERRRKGLEEARKRMEAERKKRSAEEDRRRKEEEEERKKRQKSDAAEEARRKKMAEEEKRGLREAEEREAEREKERQEEEKRRQEDAFFDDWEVFGRAELLELQRLKEVEERHRHEEQERRRREEEEARGDETHLKRAEADESQAEQDAEEARKKLKAAKDGRAKAEAEEEEKKASLRAKEARSKRIRYNLKVAVKTRDIQRLPKAIADFKGAKLPDDDKDLEKGERILREHEARMGLRRGIERRNLKELEGAIHHVKRNGFEVTLAKEMIEANKVLLQLRRLERIRAEILELKQSTVAEIRSYQKPPPIVHTVMTATFLILGHPEKETKDWKTVQALVGKTGKDGLKRRCLECEPDRIVPKSAERAKELLGGFGLDDVRDVSAGAATFYVWGETMIEELFARIASGEYDPNAPTKKEKEEAAKKAKAEAAAGNRAGSRGRSQDRSRSRSVGPAKDKASKPQSGGATKPASRSKSSSK